MGTPGRIGSHPGRSVLGNDFPSPERTPMTRRSYVTDWQASPIGGIWHRMRYVGVWHGGASYSAPYAEDAEYFPTIADAESAIRERRDSGHWCRMTFHYVFRAREYTLTPCAHGGGSGYVDLWRVDSETTPDDIRGMIENGCPDYRLEIGPRGGIVRA
jgi:hypothetical protein